MAKMGEEEGGGGGGRGACCVNITQLWRARREGKTTKEEKEKKAGRVEANWSGKHATTSRGGVGGCLLGGVGGPVAQAAKVLN